MEFFKRYKTNKNLDLKKLVHNKENTNELFIFFCLFFLVQNTRFIGRNNVFDVDEGIWSTMDFQQLKCFFNQISHIHTITLTILNLISHILILTLEETKAGEDLTIVRN